MPQLSAMRQQFLREGYLVVPDFLSPSELQVLREVQRGVALHASSAPPTPWDARPTLPILSV